MMRLPVLLMWMGVFYGLIAVSKDNDVASITSAMLLCTALIINDLRRQKGVTNEQSD